MSQTHTPVEVSAGLLTLTASQRQKRTLIERLTLEPLLAGALAVLPPQVATLEEFLQAWVDRQLFNGTLPASLQTALVLSPRQQEWLWQCAIQEVCIDDPLLHRDGLAGMAQTAAELVTAWQLQVASDAETREYRTFKRWEAKFRELSRTVTPGAQWLSPTDLTAAIVDAVSATRKTWPDRLALFGFEELTPQQRALVEAWRKAGIQIEEVPPEAPPAVAIRRMGCDDTRSELYAAARWAKQELAAGKTRITVVVPRLAALRPLVEEIFDAVLHPDDRYTATPAPRDYNLSLGLPLGSLPIIQAALALLKVTYSPEAFEQPLFWSLLRSPYWSAALDEAAGRARLEADIRDWLPLSVSLAALKARADRLDVPRLAGHMSTIIRRRADAYLLRGKQLPSVWADLFITTLNEAGWPGQRALNSAEHQAYEALVDLLVHELPAIEQVGATLDVKAALAELSLAAERKLFQPQTEGTPRVQILGLLEAIGIGADALWVTGMDDATLPAPARPNPLLPPAAQRAAQIPHASAERELQFAQRLLTNLQRCASVVIFSHPQRDGDKALQPCPLIAAYDELPTAAVSPYFPVTPVALETLPDSQGPAVPPHEPLSGGTDLIKSQAICPLWAFVSYRLGARPLGQPVDQLAATDTGNIYHLALELFWSATRTHAELMSLINAGTLEARVAEAVKAAFEQEGQRRPTPLGAVLEGCLRDKVGADLVDWLQEFEVPRQPFEVKALEQRREIDIAGVCIKTRADRIDQILPAGDVVVVDYKTGSSDRWKSWKDSRITEPQVPLYCVDLAAAGEPVGGAALAGLRRDKGKIDGFKGVTEHEGVLPGVKSLAEDIGAGRSVFYPDTHTDWPTLLARWDEELRTLAGEILAGEASLRVRRLSDLEYCPVKPVLRLPELERFRSDLTEEGEQ